MGVILGFLIALAGAALVTVGAFMIFGPWALVACGACLLGAGIAPDWEKSS